MKKIIALLLFAVLLSFAGCAPEENGLEIVTVTDTHFTGYEHYSYEGTFFDANDSNGTGKQIRYNEDLVDAFICEMLSEKPDFIIMTGDLAFNGAKVSHLAFAEKLGALSEAGIKVLVLPGNHDITGYTYIFPSGEPETAESASPEEFREIYADATDIIGLKQNPTNGRRFSPIFSFIGHFSIQNEKMLLLKQRRKTEYGKDKAFVDLSKSMNAFRHFRGQEALWQTQSKKFRWRNFTHFRITHSVFETMTRCSRRSRAFVSMVYSSPV